VLFDWYSKEKKDLNSIGIFNFDKIKEQFANNEKTNTKDIKLDEKDKVNNKIFDFKRKFTNCKWGYLNKSLIAATEDGALLTINLAGEIVNEV